MDYMTFPWEQLGGALRRLSLSGSAGNVMAWIFFLAIGSLPLIAAVFRLCRHRFRGADLLLPALAAALWTGLWFYVNPSYIDRYLSPMPTGGFSKYALASVIDSLLLTWILLRFLLHVEEAHCAETEFSPDHGLPGQKAGYWKPLSALRLLLSLYALVLAVSLLVQGWNGFRTALAALRESNSGSAAYLLDVSALFLALQAAIELLPGAAQVVLLLMMGGFLRNYRHAPFGPGSWRAMERLRLASGRLLALVLVANVGFNVLQLVFSRFLLSVSHRILFPFSEIIVLLGIRTVSFLYLESKRLKEDNDMFI